ncbi:1,3-beta-glucan synthase component Fks3 [Yamadazyma tenuis]|uniref:1,3-beta-glucan synthase n=1 Tax=Candida tenuis (strain ATCC 10573 / BCRC 21748 / CBS 615 / JCM 9827 / NBRC 10315 / NRRL Y-1498 / VKM Y-70) TaxID=590646 RepID=G3BF86_CANTC|nr:uncharacterized protein CANTEDRAFT_126740 [Yamadazyma tenuis ATCC 10573]EGV59997.1 hypothetical protein CANTEDRAFT_126740 [Yamadazyma tenuis ATCC 10573]WEJ94776.1 1,3-beta-glucan synthase component Fks3 [Yamadazyma tenuis]
MSTDNNYDTCEPTTSEALSDYQLFQDFNVPLTASHSVKEDLFSVQAYPSWCPENGAQLSQEDIKSIFFKLKAVFGFQTDSCENMFEFFMTQVDSRSSRMPCSQALLSLHSDYIGGNRSNYKKWYFMAHLELDEGITTSNIWKNYSKYARKSNRNKLTNMNNENSMLGLEIKWKTKMSKLSEADCVTQVALYLLIWGEANNVRFMPECLCFIFKCALDYYDSHLEEGKINFLQEVITPIYKFIRNQQYKMVDGNWVKNTRDHDAIIGYDDVNQFFWFPENIKRIKLADGTLLIDCPRNLRFLNFKMVMWGSCLYKTYFEKRTWLHLLTNFSRVWIIHISMFWFYTSFNSPSLYTHNYDPLTDNKPAPQVQWTIVSLGGSIACIIAFFAVIFEMVFVPRQWPGSQHLFGKLVLLLLLTMVNVAPSVYILGFLPYDAYSVHGRWVGIGQFVISITSVLYLSIKPPSTYFESIIKPNTGFIKAKIFTSSFPKLSSRGQKFSALLWLSVILLKSFESYMFLTLSLRDPIRELWSMDLSRCHGDVIFQRLLCAYHARLLLGLLFITDLVLFFLDTYLWYIILNCLFSIILSFSSGLSVCTPWRNIFLRLPERICSKLIILNGDSKTETTQLVAHIWNSIIISMYREHILPLEQAKKLIYELTDDADIGYGEKNVLVKAPSFFIFQGDNSFSMKDYITMGKEAQRRISFFAQSLTSPISEPIPTTAIPSFTVLIPHYSEKILLSLKEIIKEDKGSKVSILDYLKLLNKSDWNAFVQDTKILTNIPDRPPTPERKENHADLPYYYIGFKDSLPEYTLRTRIWASLRTQTLYRTVSGFINYEAALKILFKSEDVNFKYKNNLYPELVKDELHRFAERKFRLLISLQKYQKFSVEEKENVKYLVEAFPNIKIAYIEEESDQDTNETTYYSTLLDFTKTDSNGNFKKRLRVQLSGNPILGDGKSDNQNQSIIFYRGEYIQVIDANQDNYLEECLKIKSVLADFEEYNLDIDEEYNPNIFKPTKDPVAILGAREYIFSENIGVVGDVAAAKEQTFGTLFARTLAEIGSKLHYGHPDFLNGIFMTTRGGISKAQKGLHLNEDIYAGMMATCRGGRIKHCDYYQCGKGRDLGFNTVLNFTVKIGAGMGEQILSREHFYMGTSLPIDRFLSFYYAHAGFHLNNLFISLSVSLFMLVLLNLGALKHETIICSYGPHNPTTDIRQPLGCYNIQTVLNWVTRFVLSVFICFFISFLPLLFQELIEKGVLRAVSRIFFHFISLSPIFEVFVCQIYAKSLEDNITYGTAKYIATGRGFATVRQPFTSLFSRYSSLSLYKGSTFFLTVLFSCITMWQPSLLWFFISFISMCLAPILFNPHQFSFAKFFLDYRELMRWFSRGNYKWHNSSWYGYQKVQRSKVLGYKKTVISTYGRNVTDNRKRTSKLHQFSSQVLLPFIPLFFNLTAFMFMNAQTGVRRPKEVNPLIRIVLVALLPLMSNVVVLALGFALSCILGSIFRFRKFSSTMAAIGHGIASVITMVTFEVLLYLESWNFSRALCGFILVISIHGMLRNILFLFLTKELKDDTANHSWWSGRWFNQGLKLLVITQPVRELSVKLVEMMSFSYDFLLCQGILFCVFPLLFVPFIDKLHTIMLFWSEYNKNNFRSAIISKRLQRKRRRIVILHFILFTTMLVIFIGLATGPVFASRYIPELKEVSVFPVPDVFHKLVQPNHQNHNDTGPEAPPTVLRERPEMSSMKSVF